LTVYSRAGRIAFPTENSNGMVTLRRMSDCALADVAVSMTSRLNVARTMIACRFINNSYWCLSGPGCSCPACGKPRWNRSCDQLLHHYLQRTALIRSLLISFGLRRALDYNYQLRAL